MRAPFPYFGGKSTIAQTVWARLGTPRQYIEPFCGSAAMLLAAPAPASLEVIGDVNHHVANFWRATKCQPEAVWSWSDYPVSHVDLYARHVWLTEASRVAALRESLMDAEWPGDAQIAGWWVWGQCCWIGSGWCERERPDPARGQRGHGAAGVTDCGQIPHASSAGMGLQAAGLGKVPHASSAGRGLQAAGLGKVPHASSAGMGLQAAGLGKVPHAGDAGRGEYLSPHREGARAWLHALSRRLERVRVTHGTWDRCLNSHYGDTATAVFLDPPYRAYERLYAAEGSHPVADDVAAWAAEHVDLRVALCGHAGDYDLPGWATLRWERAGNTYGGDATKDAECVWFSPACEAGKRPEQISLFGATP